MWLLLDSLSPNYSASLLTARATGQIPLNSVVLLVVLEKQLVGQYGSPAGQRNGARLGETLSFILFSSLLPLSSAGLNRSSNVFYTPRYALETKP
jgi:hypothetical protein